MTNGLILLSLNGGYNNAQFGANLKRRLLMNDFNENAKEIKRKASALYDTAKEKAGNAYYETKPKAEELASQIGNTASDLYQSGKEGVCKVEESLEDSLGRVAHSIRKQPLTSVLLAAGIGYVFAKIFR